MYVQRYLPYLPAAGEIVIFDRSWYNRAGVERVMGFCTEEQARKFLKAVPLVEQAIVESGVILLKYWLEVTPEEQTRRLKDRIDDGRKTWKLTGMDLKSYSRWFDYSRARDEMFAATDTGFAPWYVARSDDKKRARLNLITPPAEQDSVRGTAAGQGETAQARQAARLSRSRVSVQVRGGAVLRLTEPASGPRPHHAVRAFHRRADCRVAVDPVAISRRLHLGDDDRRGDVADAASRGASVRWASRARGGRDVDRTARDPDRAARRSAAGDPRSHGRARRAARAAAGDEVPRPTGMARQSAARGRAPAGGLDQPGQRGPGRPDGAGAAAPPCSG